MTSFSYVLEFSDGEAIALKSALTRHIAFCDERLADGGGAPFWAEKRSAQALLRQMESHRSLRSTNTFTAGSVHAAETHTPEA